MSCRGILGRRRKLRPTSVITLPRLCLSWPQGDHPNQGARYRMKIQRLVAVAVAALALSAAAAQAAPGFSTANVNIRTGPDIDFPSVGVIPEGEPLSIEGCLRDESWCDVRWDGGRGWVYSEYLAFDDRGEMVPLPDVGRCLLPHSLHHLRGTRLLGSLLRRTAVVPRPGALVRFPAASARRLACPAAGTAPRRLVASGLPRSCRHGSASGPWLAPPRSFRPAR